MVDISTEYLGLKLQSPIIAGSSGLTNTVDNLIKMADNGAGAVVLKSIFEEEVAYEYADFIATSQKPGHDQQYFDYDGQKNPIAYYDYVIREENLKKNITLVEKSKTAVSIPVIASSGAGKVEHFSEVFEKTDVEATLAAGIFHREEIPIEAVKEHMRDEGIETR